MRSDCGSRSVKRWALAELDGGALLVEKVRWAELIFVVAHDMEEELGVKF